MTKLTPPKKKNTGTAQAQSAAVAVCALKSQNTCVWASNLSLGSRGQFANLPHDLRNLLAQKKKKKKKREFA